MAGTIPLLAQRAASEAPSLDARSWDHPTHPLEIVSLRPCRGTGASLGEEAVLADSGRAGEIAARVGWVRSMAFLSIPRDGSSAVPHVMEH